MVVARIGFLTAEASTILAIEVDLLLLQGRLNATRIDISVEVPPQRFPVESAPRGVNHVRLIGREPSVFKNKLDFDVVRPEGDADDRDHRVRSRGPCADAERL